MNSYTVHSLTGRYLVGPREAASHEDALLAAAERDNTRFDGTSRPVEDRIFAEGGTYIVSDVRGPEQNERVKALRLIPVTQPTFVVEAVNG